MGRLGKPLFAAFCVAPSLCAPAWADFSASLAGSSAEFAAAGTADLLTIRLDPTTGRLRHNRFTAGDPGFASDFDFDSTRLGIQWLSPGDAVIIRIAGASQLVDLVVDDAAATLAGVCTIADRAVEHLFGGSVRIEYETIRTVTLRCGSAADILTVESTAGVADRVVVDGGAGADVIVLADLTNSLDALTTPIDVLGGAGADGLTLVDERPGADAVAYQIDAGGVSRSLAAAQLRIDLPGDDVEDLRILAGAGADRFLIDSLPPGIAAGSVVVECGAGDDDVAIEDSAATVRGITAPLAIDGGPGSNRLTVVDSGETVAKTLTVSSTRLGLGVDDAFFPPGGWLEYANIADLEVRLGAGKDDIHVSPSATAAIRLVDADPAPGPLFDGDRIDVVTAGAADPVVASPGVGHIRYSFADRRDVDFIGFERMRPGGTIRGLVFLDRNGDGVRQPDEPPQPFAAVALSIDGLPATAWGRVADADGAFEFPDLIPAEYRLAALPFAGHAPSTPDALVPLEIEQVVEDVRLGLRLVAGGSVSGLVFNDADFSGSLTGSETGLAQAVVFADLNGDAALNAHEPRLVTPADGSFLLTFPEDTAGSLLVIGPSGYVTTTPGAPFDVRSGGSLSGIRLGLALHPVPPADGGGSGGGSGDTGGGGSTPPGDGGGSSGGGSGGGASGGTAPDGGGSASGGGSNADNPDSPLPDGPDDSALDNPDVIARRCASCGNLGLLGWVSLLIPLAAIRATSRRRR